MEKVKRFSDFASEDEKPLEGEKVKIESILNKEIIICGCKIRPSKYKEKSENCATVQFFEKGNEQQKNVFFTGSSVIISMLNKYENEIPFETVIKKIDKYYSFT